MEKHYKEASIADSIVPIVILILLLGSSVILFGDSSSSGPNQIALLIAMGVAAIVGIKNGYSWREIEEGIVI